MGFVTNVNKHHRNAFSETTNLVFEEKQTQKRGFFLRTCLDSDGDDVGHGVLLLGLHQADGVSLRVRGGHLQLDSAMGLNPQVNKSLVIPHYCPYTYYRHLLRDRQACLQLRNCT